MSIQDRRAEILGLLNERHQLTVEDLADLLDVSRETIRRDLVALHEEGRIRKYHGGARALRDLPIESPWPQRLIQNVDAKQRIAAALTRDLSPGSTLMVDTGTTTQVLAEHLGGISDLTVITNAPRIAELVAGNRANRVFLLGGAYNAEVGENLGPLVIEQIGRFRASVAVLTVGAIGSEGIMDYDLAEAEVARAMISRADRVFVLADSSKFERRAVFDVAPLSAIARLYTDSAPSVAMTDRLQEAGVEIRIE